MSIDYTNENSIFLTIGRMNPPTPGHLFVIRTLIEHANDRGVTEVYVILTTTNNTPDNPIVCQDKKAVLGDGGNEPGTMIYNLKQMMQNDTQDPGKKQLIADTIVHVICTDKGPFVAISELVDKKKDVNLFIVLGGDREDTIDNITKFYYKLPNVHSVAKDALQRENMAGIKTQSKDPVSLKNFLKITKMSDIVEGNGMSASLVRNIVNLNDADTKNKFIELYSPYLDDTKINDLYNEILTGMISVTLKKTPAASKTKEKPKYVSPYTYPVIKDADMDKSSLTKKRKLSEGGRKKKTKKTKKKTKKRKKRTRTKTKTKRASRKKKK